MKEKEIAIIGMACMFPAAPDLQTFWHNIVSKVDAVDEVPSERWDTTLFYDPNPAVRDKVYCKRGGYLSPNVPFNPTHYGVMPLTVEGGDPDQFLVLRVAYEAMEDAGYLDRDFNAERAEFILGRGGYPGAGMTNLVQRSQVTEQTLGILKALHPEYSAAELHAIKKAMLEKLPRFEAETVSAVIPNIVTGRVANRLGMMGPNYTIDAACASSLIAVDMAVQDLRAGRADLALAGGVHVATSVSFLMVFCAMNALSPSAQIRPYDEHADGTLPGEGVGLVVLKRLADAQRDGDRIYAVIKGVGTSSDGRAKSVLAPRVEGAVLALQRAYADADVSPHTIGLIEGHGTGTPAGDTAELQTLARVFGDEKATGQSCSLGSVKSMIGHAMPAAGAAGLIKTALALYHQVLPPTLHCESPHPLLKQTPLYVNTEKRPWIHDAQRTPRRAGVNALGFGGVNAHVVLEEYVPSTADESPRHSEFRLNTSKKIPEEKRIGEMSLSLGYPMMSVPPRTPEVNVGESLPSSDTESRSHHTSPPPQTPPGASSTQQTMQTYLQTMTHFLEVQQQVMQAYLTGSGRALSPTEMSASERLPAFEERGVKTTPPHGQHEWGETDESGSASQAVPPSEFLTQNDPLPKEAPPAATAMSAEVAFEPDGTTARPSLQDILLSIVSEKTGYPPEMLELELDMEADLGIDSIKRAEIFGLLQERSTFEAEVDIEELATLTTLREVIELLDVPSGRESSRPPVHPQTAEPTPYPLIGEVISFAAGRELKCIRRIDWNADPFIQDHTVGYRCSDTDEGLRSLPVVPMTVSIEMMAEAAALLFPGKQLIEIRDVTARQWIYMELECPHVDVATQAVVKSTDTAQAKIYAPDSPDQSPWIEGIFRFADTFPEPPIAEPLVLKGSRKPNVTASEIYAQNLIFNGPRFQGVAALDAIGEDGLLAELEVLPTHNLFQSTPHPVLLTDPCLFDVAGQLVGYWPLEYLDKGFVLFPMRVEEVQLFHQTPPVSTRVRYQMYIRELTPQQLHADMDIILPDGRVWMRVIGWKDWRFYWPETFCNFWRFPKHGFVTRSLSLPETLAHIECGALASLDNENLIWRLLWAHLVLSRREREAYRDMQMNPQSTEWLFGRAAAKDVVRRWLKRSVSLEVYPADVELQNNAFGGLSVAGEWAESFASTPSVSIAHSDGITVAAVGDVPFIGVDIAPLQTRMENSERDALTQSEDVLLEQVADAHREEWRIRFKCGKVAVTKAAGRGQLVGTNSVVVHVFDEKTGLLQVMLGQNFAESIPEFTAERIQVVTRRDGDYIVAVAICESRSVS